MSYTLSRIIILRYQGTKAAFIACNEIRKGTYSIRHLDPSTLHQALSSNQQEHCTAYRKRYPTTTHMHLLLCSSHDSKSIQDRRIVGGSHCASSISTVNLMYLPNPSHTPTTDCVLLVIIKFPCLLQQIICSFRSSQTSLQSYFPAFISLKCSVFPF